MSTTRRVIAAIAAVLALSACAPASATAPVEDWPTTYPPCPTEDSSGPCFWDAKAQGNGHGRSFWVLSDGTVIHVIEREEAYAAYSAAFRGGGCLADFNANYLGTRFVRDLPDDVRQDLAEGRLQLDSEGYTDQPGIADFEGGSVVEVLNGELITQVIVISAYDGRC